MFSMPDVCAKCVWEYGRTVFSVWLAAGLFVANVLFVAIRGRMSFGNSVFAGATMSGLAWLLIAGIPIPMYAYVIGWELIFGERDDPFSWIIPVLIAAFIGASAGTLVLKLLKQQIARSTFWLLVAVNTVGVGVGVFRMWAYVSTLVIEA